HEVPNPQTGSSTDDAEGLFCLDLISVIVPLATTHVGVAVDLSEPALGDVIDVASSQFDVSLQAGDFFTVDGEVSASCDEGTKQCVCEAVGNIELHPVDPEQVFLKPLAGGDARHVGALIGKTSAARDHSDASHGTRLVAIEDLRCRERIEQGEADVLIAVGAGANAKDVVLRAPLIGKAGQEVPVLGRRTTDSAAQFKLEVEHSSFVFEAFTRIVDDDASLSGLTGHIVVKHDSSAEFGGDPPG